MSNSEQPITIARNTNTVSITFVQKPTDEQRRQLKEAGFRYESGNWFKSQTQGYHATGEVIDQLLAA
jgi:hypothetical protein